VTRNWRLHCAQLKPLTHVQGQKKESLSDAGDVRRNPRSRAHVGKSRTLQILFKISPYQNSETKMR
jgi:hypothetical protein